MLRFFFMRSFFPTFLFLSFVLPGLQAYSMEQQDEDNICICSDYHSFMGSNQYQKLFPPASISSGKISTATVYTLVKKNEGERMENTTVRNLWFHRSSLEEKLYQKARVGRLRTNFQQSKRKAWSSASPCMSGGPVR